LTKKTKKSSSNSLDYPRFYDAYQIFKDNSEISLFPKPVFCTQEKALSLALENCKINGYLITIKLHCLNSEEAALQMLNSTELELSKYTKDIL